MDLRIEKFVPEMIMDQKLPTDWTKWDKQLQKLIANFEFKSTAIYFMDISLLLTKYVITNFKPHEHMFSLDTFFSKKGYLGLSLAISYLLEDTAANHFIFCLRNYLNSEQNKFYFSSDFFDDLKQTNLDGIRFCDLIEGSGVIRLPYDILDDEGTGFNEFLFYLGPVKTYSQVGDLPEIWEIYKNKHDVTDSTLQLSISWLGRDKSYNFVAFPVVDPETPVRNLFLNIPHYRGIQSSVVDDGYKSHIKPLINCLAYLKTGDPDLRTFKNTIKYQSSTSATPVKKDKTLSLNNITLVGYGFKKNPQWTKTVYYQPPYYARRGTNKVWTWCRGSFKKRKSLVDS